MKSFLLCVFLGDQQDDFYVQKPSRSECIDMAFLRYVFAGVQQDCASL